MSRAWKLDAEASALLAALETVVTEVVAPHAAAVDAEARFPAESIAALKEAGVLRLLSAKSVGGKGLGLRAAAAVVERIAHECPSTAMITTMHLCATAVIEQYGTDELRRAIAEGGKLSTLAFSESGSRSHFWMPVSTAERTANGVKLNAKKQLITSAGQADVFVWSSRPAAGEGLSSIWAVPADSNGLVMGPTFEGLGYRGNCSSPLLATDVTVAASAGLGEDGKGFDVMMGTVMPYFSILNASVSLGMMEGVFARTIQHVTATKYSYDDSPLAALPQVRGHVARMKVKIDMVGSFLLDAVDAIENSREDAMLRVLEAKAVGSESSLEVHDLAMRVCGGAAYRKDVAVERFFRDSRASTVMAPVTDALYDFIGKAVCGMPVFG